MKKFSNNYYFLMILPPFFWALNWIIARHMRFEIEPITMSFVRWFIAFLILCPFGFIKFKNNFKVVKQNFKILLILGILGTITFNTLVYIGLKYTFVINGSLLNTLIPVFIVLISLTFKIEKFTILKLMGVLTSFLGAVYIIFDGNLNKLARIQVNVGDIWIIVAMLVWAIYTIILKNKPKELDSVSFLFTSILLGLPFLFPFFIWEIFHHGFPKINLSIILTFIFYGTFPSIISYLIWNNGVKEIGPTNAGVYTYLLPVFGIILSIIFLDETFLFYHLVGTVLILIGIFLVNRKNFSSNEAN